MRRCAADWADPGLPAWGTAARATFWVGLEQPGPWGTKAATQSRLLDPDVGAAIENWCIANGGRFLLLRSPCGADEQQKLLRRVFVAGNLCGEPWLGTTQITGPASLLGLLSDAMVAKATSRPAQFDHHLAILTVCTNGRRDQCCARGGLALGRELVEEHPGQIWECSHLGGHRFAPTGLLWPTGQVLGRLNSRVATDGLQMAERGLVLGAGATYDRGRSHLPPEGQAAEAYVRSLLHPQSAAAISSTIGDEPGSVTVSHADGRTWDLLVVRETLGEDRLESCEKAPIPTVILRVRER